MIELKKNTSTDYFDIYVNNKLCDGAYAEGSLKVGYNYYSSLSATSKLLASLRVEEFLPFETIRLSNLFNWRDINDLVEVSKFETDTEQFLILDINTERFLILNIKITFEADLLKWKRNYSFEEYAKLFNECWNTNRREPEKLKIEFEENIKITLTLDVHRFDIGIKKLIVFYEKLLNSTHGQTIDLLRAKYNEQILFFPFNFPTELKFACEQYLIYFAQFLRDLGIDATSNLKEEAGKVLFSITPTDDEEALDKILGALSVYLKLPSSPIIYDESFAAMRLQQQIDNLEHSQKMAVREIQLAEKVIMIQSETIQDKNIIISQKDSVIDQQNKVIEKIASKSIIMDSLENKEELEEIFDGLKIGKSKFLMEQLGVHLNPATALKTVSKKILGKEDENKSILGLDEETDKEDN